MARCKQLTVEVAEKQIEYWEKIRAILLRITERPDDDISTRIIKKYLKLGSVSAVATELNSEGYLTKSRSTGKPCKYSSNDISDTIRGIAISDREMQVLAQMILQDHSAFINRIFN